MSVKVNTIKTIHNGRIFKVVSENITFPNGLSSNMDIIRHPGAAAIVPLADNDSIILLKQYRHAIGGYIWEIPAGTLEENETPERCAQRELVEEAGWSANNWTKLGEIISVPGYSDERIHLFLATDLELAAQNLDQNEILDVYEIKLSDALDMIYNGKIQDGKTIAGLFLTEKYLQNRKR